MRLGLAFVLALCACRGDLEEGALHEGWSGTPPAAPAAVGERCDLQWVECVEDAFCDLGNAEGQPACFDEGTCVSAPETCDPIAAPVCGCDGELYSNPCEAAQAGIGTRGAVGCTPPAGFFSCGFEFCAIATQFCEYTVGHGQSPSWRCLDLECPPDTTGCACITDPAPCGDPYYFPGQWCTELPGGGTEFTCLPA